MAGMGIDFRLRFERSQIDHWAKGYLYQGEENVEQKSNAKKLGYLSKKDFLALCEWKTLRSRRFCKTNGEEFIRSVTSTALTTKNEQLRIEVLTLLCGVEWPTASVILHFCSTDRYPILDFRALWSLSSEVPKKYDFKFWWEYTGFCRRLAGETGATMRTLDRALWQFSKANQVVKGS
jgi:hypothetical protein